MNRTKGPYFVDGSGYAGQGHDADVIDHNRPSPGQPGLWCQWLPNDDGSALVWDEGEKAYDMAEWLEWVIDHLLKPGAVASTVGDPQFVEFTFDHVCNGRVNADGEDSNDFWAIKVTDNAVTVHKGTVSYDGLD
jgi:hypothetical protein